MATPRDIRVSEALAWVVEDLPARAEHRWLVVDDHGGKVVPAISEGEIATWSRSALGNGAASPTPPSGVYDWIVLRLPRGHASLRMVAHQVMAHLSPEGTLVVGGANDEGVKPVARRLEEVAEHTEVLATRRHCRVVAAKGPKADLRPGLEDWAEEVEATVDGVSLAWRSWPSLFAHGRLDPGTALLLDSLPPLEGAVLDFACGAGAVGQFLLRRGDEVTLDLSDVNALAVHAARHNVPGATVSLADGLPVEGGPWKVVVSNPPVHSGKDSDRSVLAALAATAPHRLRRNGELWVVVQGTVSVQRHLESAFRTVERVARNRSYGVWRCRR